MDAKKHATWTEWLALYVELHDIWGTQFKRRGAGGAGCRGQRLFGSKEISFRKPPPSRPPAAPPPGHLLKLFEKTQHSTGYRAVPLPLSARANLYHILYFIALLLFDIDSIIGKGLWSGPFLCNYFSVHIFFSFYLQPFEVKLD